ncbi:MAG: twin-arginine translocation signal domain-containing protein, partial [Granulosicoccus sp.]|nr:twin-arginine translocation signal domain-containing protein [Granulosicoccus sp.]
MSRRKFLTTSAAGIGAVAAGSGLITAAPAIAQSKTKLTVVSTWPRDFPGLGISAQRLVARISELSEGRIETE